ncbi:hypothetical protein EV424DRAFT_1376234 [Suillus variegatus]|nr:hypothetical protein EV424DRAFT_1376234 [Suillus variegatus]
MGGAHSRHEPDWGAIRAQQEAEARARAAAEAARQEAERAAQAAQARRHFEAEQAEAARRAQAAREEAKRQRREREQAEQAARAAREAAEAWAREEREPREEENRRLQAEREAAERAAQRAAEEARQAQAAREEAERQLRDGTRPVMQHTEGFFHVAVSGIAGSGKSSLVNAFRGKHNMDLDAAAVGVNETTLVVARYPDPNPSSRFRVPLKVPDWKYFNDQGLFVFDCIIVVVNNRFTATDVAILSNARRFGIPAFIVRSKADQHIRNLMKDIGYNSDDEGGNKASYFARARDQYVAESIRSIRTNLQEANIPDQPVYLVSNVALQATVTGKTPKKMMDEVKLLTDLASTAQRHV